MLDEKELAARPIVQESVQHNARVRNLPPAMTSPPSLTCPPTAPSGMVLICMSPQTVSNIRALTASLFGVAAGTLGLESWPGFIFYFLGTAIVSVLIFSLKAENNPKAFFYQPFGDLWIGDMFGGLMSFILTWTLFYGLCKA